MALIRITLLPRAIRRELLRLDAAELHYRNLGYGLGALEGSGADGFRSQGKSREILDQLRELPDGAGPDAVRSAFSGSQAH